MAQRSPAITGDSLAWLGVPISDGFHGVIPSVHNTGQVYWASPCP